METITITSQSNPKVYIHAAKGHFITSNAHISCYVGTSAIKHEHEVSTEAAKMLAKYYIDRDIKVDTVLCLYETQALGAYIAHELASPSMMCPNPDPNVFVLGPEYDAMGNMIFRDNLVRMISGKNVLILISCITSGKTIERAMESVAYYGGTTVGIATAFSATKQIAGVEVNTIFTKNDLPEYNIYDKHSCPLCDANIPVNALANGYGYSKL